MPGKFAEIFWICEFQGLFSIDRKSAYTNIFIAKDFLLSNYLQFYREVYKFFWTAITRGLIPFRCRNSDA